MKNRLPFTIDITMEEIVEDLNWPGRPPGRWFENAPAAPVPFEAGKGEDSRTTPPRLADRLPAGRRDRRRSRVSAAVAG